MKKTLLTTALLFLISGMSWGQGMEDFTNINIGTGTSYVDGNFVGNDGITWTYVDSRDDNEDANNSGINQPALMLRALKAGDYQGKITSSTITGGIGDFSVKFYRGFTNNTVPRQVELFINGVSRGISDGIIDTTEHVFIVEDINVGGDVVIEIRNIKSQPVIIDDITWTTYSPGTATKLAIKSINPTTPIKGEGFDITVEAQTADGNPTAVSSDVNFTITRATGTGALGGTTTGTIKNGRSSVTLSGITYSQPETIVSLTATDNSSTLGPGTSTSFSVITSDTFVENFDNLELSGASYVNGSFVGNNSITWTYVNTRDENGDANNSGIKGKALMFQDNTEAKVTSSTISGGISNFSVKLYKGFTAAGNRQVELFVNEVSIGTSDSFDDFSEHVFSVNNINITGDVIIEIKNFTANRVIIDDITWDSYEKFDLAIEDTEGWRMLTTPTTSNTYKELLNPIWTQGIAANANTTVGAPSVQTFDIAANPNAFDAISDLENVMTPSQGFITYVFADDDYNGTADAFPKNLSVTGIKNAPPISANLNTAADKWTLVGNPFASSIKWADIEKTDLTGVAYVYDHSYNIIDGGGEDASTTPIGGYRTWNGTTGGLTDGKIATFQGFWVQNVAAPTAPELKFIEASKSTGGQFYKQSTQSASFRMIAKMDGRANDAYFSFTNEGEIGKDNYDGFKLSPLDHADYLSLGTEVEGVLMDINNLPWDIKESVEFPVEINSFTKLDDGYALKGGEVTLSLADLKNIPADWGIVFNNYNTGETIDLRAQESYTFQVAAKAKMVKAKTAFSVLSPVGVTREKSMGSSGFSITIQPENTSVNLEPKDEPKVFALEQNYPNPFNPTTTIKYSVKDNGPVNLAVYNIMGQKVAELVNSTKQAGNYAISWQAQDMASGLYFYRLSAAGQTITRQMTLIK